MNVSVIEGKGKVNEEKSAKGDHFNYPITLWKNVH